MNEHEGTLLTIAELGLALGGFAAIVLVLARGRDDVRLVSSTNVRSMIVNAVSGAWGATIPILGAGIGLSGASLWRFSSLLWLAAAALIAWPAALATLSRTRASGKLNLRQSVLLYSLAAAATTIHALNAAGFPYSPSYAGFVVGIWVALSVATFQFLLLILALLK